MIEPSALRALQGASNFRDLGGYRGAGGGRVRPGRVFRSDHLASLTPSDVAALQALALTHSIDFRGAAECAAQPYRIPGVTTLAFSIEPTVVTRMRKLVALGIIPSAAETVALMCETYRDFVHDHGPTFGRFLRHLLSHPTPVVFHCTAGKDRTGFAAALLLSVLGVDRDSIMQDYLLTNSLYRRSPSLEGVGPAHVMEVLWQVQPAFLQAAFDAVDRDHGGLSSYLLGTVGLQAVELEQLREALLEH
ncbi:MAG: tyrosine-protein phosphatase [Rhodoferax sp.]